MSTTIEIKVPDIGNVHDVEVVAVEVQTGDVIAVDQTLITLETDKASMDVPSSAAGTVQQVHLKVGDKVNEGSVIITVLVSDEAAAPAAVAEVAPTPAPAVEEVKAVEVAPAPKPAAPAPVTISAPVVAKGKAHASPAVRLLARELGVDISQITNGNGRKGRILKDDAKLTNSQVST
jgi:pyruvate dehydrogenase E2 component (dihydrolipoamide acetyltransferase)